MALELVTKPHLDWVRTLSPAEEEALRAVKAGESLTLTGTCGGGYGEAAERPADAVAEDVRDGYISRETAESMYGVVVTEAGALDTAATEVRRGSPAP